MGAAQLSATIAYSLFIVSSLSLKFKCTMTSKKSLPPFQRGGEDKLGPVPNFPIPTMIYRRSQKTTYEYGIAHYYSLITTNWPTNSDQIIK